MSYESLRKTKHMSDVSFQKIRSIKRVPAEPVYDIQVKKNHNFFANSLVTHNCLIFQEDVMQLAEIVGGFPKDQCDNVRRAIMKRDLSKGDAAIKEAKKLEDDYVKGAMTKGVPEATARKSYETILWFAGYGFNRAHAVAYAIDSYMCAWLHTHYEEEWLCTYLESMSNNPEDKARAFGDVKQTGYSIVPIDVNYANHSWTILPGKKFMPSLMSCKGVGESAIEELVALRPLTKIEDLLYNEDGSWKPSKFNKKALSALIKLHAFDSLDCVGEGKLFDSYKHMYEVLIENGDAIKKTPKKDPHQGMKTMYALARELKPFPEWTKREIAENQVEVLGNVDVLSLIEPSKLERLEQKGVKSIDEWEEKGFYWACINSVVPKKTKTGKQYLLMNVMGPSGKEIRLNAWGWDGVRSFDQFTVILAEIDKNEFGCSTTMWRCKEIA